MKHGPGVLVYFTPPAAKVHSKKAAIATYMLAKFTPRASSNCLDVEHNIKVIFLLIRLLS